MPRNPGAAVLARKGRVSVSGSQNIFTNLSFPNTEQAADYQRCELELVRTVGNRECGFTGDNAATVTFNTHAGKRAVPARSRVAPATGPIGLRPRTVSALALKWSLGAKFGAQHGAGAHYKVSVTG